MLAKINVTPPDPYTAPSGYSTYIDFKIVSTDTLTAALSTGLPSGSTYPSSGLSTSSVLTITYTSAETDAHTSHLIVTASSWICSTAVTFYVPFPSLTAGTSYTVTSSIVTTFTDGSIYYMTNGDAAASSFIAPAANADIVTITAISTTAQSSDSLTLTWGTAQTLATDTAVGLSFDFGYSVFSPILTATTALATTTYSSSNVIFPYLTLYSPLLSLAQSLIGL